MKRNIGTADMAVRLILGVVLAYIGFFDNPIVSSGLPKTLIAVIAFVPLLTGLIRFCPLYALIGASTNSAKSE